MLSGMFLGAALAIGALTLTITAYVTLCVFGGSYKLPGAGAVITAALLAGWWWL